MEVINEWIARPDSKRGMSPAKSNLDPRPFIDRLDKFEPQPASVEFYVDAGLAWVQVWYDDIVSPAVVVPLGQALAGSSKDTVLFHSLRPRSIYYIVDNRQMAASIDAELPATDYGVSLKDLDAWPRPASVVKPGKGQQSDKTAD